MSDVCRYEEMVQYPERNLPTKYLTVSCHLPTNNIFFQKQPPDVFFKKKVFLEISQNSQETPASESLF